MDTILLSASEIASKLARCQESIGYTFRDPELLHAALTHTSGATTRLVSNERLEFLGDAILGAIVVDLLYHDCPTMMEGEMTQLKSAIVSRAACTRVSNLLNLKDCLILGRGMGNGKLPPSLLANLQEAIIGAIYLDGGMVVARDYVMRAFRDEIRQAIDGDAILQNFKMLLQQRVQKSFHTTPRYAVQDQKGPDHRRCYLVQVRFGNRAFHSAWGRNKKEAEQRAAENALAELDGLAPIYPADE